MIVRSARRISSRGGIVTGWLVRVVIILLLLGLVAFEAGAVIVAKVGVDGTAETAAREAALIYESSRNADSARAEAERAAAQGGARLIEFAFSPEGTEVVVTLERVADTFVIQKIGPLRKHRIARSTHRAKIRS